MSNKAYAQYTISDIRDGIDGLGILEIEEQYYISRCNTPPLAQNDSSYNENNWGTQPTWEEGYYIWTRVKITWDNDVNDPEHITYTTPVLATTYQSLHSDIINNVIPNIATKDSNGNWSIVSGVLHNTFVYYTDEEGQQQPVRLENLGSTIVQTANEIRQEVSNNYVSSNEIDASYVICNTSASTATKIATCYNQDASSSFELANGTRITCVFANGNTAENPTLSVNGTTAKPIKTFAGNTLTESEYTWDAGTTFTLVYNTSNGGSWNIEGSEGVLKVYSNSTLIDQTANNILIQATNGTNMSDTDVGDALISFINVAPDEVKISAGVIDFEGAAIFSDYLKTENLSTELTNRGYITSTKIGETYATKTDVIVSTQRIYKQTADNSTPSTPSDASSDWVVSTSDVDKWTTQRRSYNPNYPYLWTCEQRKTAEGKLLYTPVLLDDTTTVIDGGKIIAHSITSNAISTDLIKSNNYSPPTGDENSGTGTYPYSVSGTYLNLSNGDITSQNFVVKGSNAYLKGTIETGAGHIGGFVITENSIYHNKRDVTSVDLSDDIYIINSDPYVLDEEDYLYGGYASLYEVYMGIDGISCGFGKFAVDSTGELFASNATIKGNITATSGSFGTGEGYYQINDNGLIGYKKGFVYYYEIFKYSLSSLASGYDINTIKVSTDLSLTTINPDKTYSYNDILNLSDVKSIGLRFDDDYLYITIEVKENISLADILGGTLESGSCSISYRKTDGNIAISSMQFTSFQVDGVTVTRPISSTEDYVSGTELGYDYLKTGKLIASDGLIIVDENNQNAISISSSSVIVGNSLDDSESSYIYIDSNNFTVFDSSHAEAFLVSSDGALLVTKKRIKKGLNISSYSASSSSPTTQTVTIDCVARNIPTESSYDTAIVFDVYGRHIDDDENKYWQFFKLDNSVNIEDIKNAGASGLTINIPYQNDNYFWDIIFTYNSQSQVISAVTRISSVGQRYMKQIFANFKSYSYTETTESMTPYFSIGSRKENTTLGGYSITGGYNIEASGNYSQAFGCGTVAQGAFQTVIGKYNLPVGTNDSVSNSVSNTDFAFMIGNGTSDNARTNAFAVDWNGTAHLRSIRSIRHSYVGPCPDGDAYEEIFVGNMTYRAQEVYDEPVDIAAWICATIIALCEDYPGKNQTIFKGRIVPNSAAYFEICIYDTSTTEIAYDYMPQYAYGVYRQWPNAYWIIWVDEYEFHYKAL